MVIRNRSIIIYLSFLLFGFLAPLNGQIKDISPDLFKNMKYRHIGPVGNRVIAVIGQPGNPKIYYAGAASGGIFKSIDGGIHWKPVFDDQPAASIGALAMTPSDPNVIWAGTGETFIRSNISIGSGIYKSTDGGKTWKHMGLDNTGRIGRIVIDPRNPKVVLAAAMGHCYGPQQERGVFRTGDGGKTWERVLFVDENTGCSDIAMDPNNPRILVAGMWQLEIKTWVRKSGGKGSGLYMSRDGGSSWKKLEGNGLPKPPLGKIGIAIAPNDSNRMYALIETPQFEFKGVLWRSDDGGDTWHLISHDQEYTQRPHYYSRCAVSPNDADEVYFLAHGVWKSVDAGKNAFKFKGIAGDDHDMWIDPKNPDRMIVGNDQGVAVSITRGKSWHRPLLPIAQMYHAAVDNRIPYYIYGNRQDGPSVRCPSNSRTKEKRIPIGLWHSVGGFECGFTVIDPVDNHIIWSGNYDGYLTRYNLQTGHIRNVTVWPNEPMGWPPGELKYRWNWTFPLVISPHDHNKVYVGSQYVHVTTNGGHSWEVISPDLTTNDKSKQVTSGGLTIDNIGVDYGCTLFAIAESPVKKGVIWTGSNDGQVYVTLDDGKNWNNVGKNIRGCPEWGTISNIEPSRFKAAACYITIDLHQMNNRNPYVYKTDNYGNTWQLISSGIPKSVFSYAHCVREDPERPGLLYLGTENSLYISFNDGRQWHLFQNNLPHAPVHWLTIQSHFSDLVAATYGRGFWILDDITPLRQINDKVLYSDVFLFKPRPAYRFQEIHEIQGTRTGADGKNPPYGASIHYYLEQNTSEKVKLIIMDKNKTVVRTLKVPGEKGINRVWWDLRFEKTVVPHLRTPPLGYPGEYAGPERLRYGKKGWRKLVTWGRKGDIGPRVIPGTYTIRLSIGDKKLEEKIEIRKDPNTEGTVEDIEKQIKLALEIRDNISAVSEMINGLEWLRRQLRDLRAMLKEDPDLDDLLEAAQKLDQQCVDVEKNLFQLTLTGTEADDLRGPTMLYSKLMNLNMGVQTGDFPPTRQQMDVYELLSKKLANYRMMYEHLINKEVPVFNRMLREKNFLNIIFLEKWKGKNKQ
jgi:photosystem II stability/assembly factor-like uncharacterized protein